MARTFSSLALTATVAIASLTACSSDKDSDGVSTGAAGSSSRAPATQTSKAPALTAPKADSGVAANTTTMTKLRTISGKLTSKSVDASGTGLVIANNMIYTHTVTLFNAGTGQRIVDIPDTVDLKDFGLSNTSVKLKGGPVEGVWSKDAKYVYVSNYVMSGPGYHDEPNDLCTGQEKYKPSYVYRINVAEQKIDEVIAAGAVPKYVALTPDGTKLLVSNWCSYSMSVIDLATKKQEKQIPVARWPRGIATSPDGRYAYVAAFGTPNLYRVDLERGTSSVFAVVGDAARHVTASPDGAILYVVSSHANTVTKLDRATGRKLGQTKALIEPRSMAISPDGKALYVVNYDANSVTKIDIATMKKLQVVHVGAMPIGITYEPRTGQVWVAMYSGTIEVYDDNKAAS